MSKNSETQMRWQRNHPELARHNKRVYFAKRGGYAPPNVNELDAPARSSDGGCWLCLRKVDPGKLHFDHDHNSGNFRGWLCVDCNLKLGFVEKKIGLSAIRDYIAKKLPWQ